MSTIQDPLQVGNATAASFRREATHEPNARRRSADTVSEREDQSPCPKLVRPGEKCLTEEIEREKEIAKGDGDPTRRETHQERVKDHEPAPSGALASVLRLTHRGRPLRRSPPTRRQHGMVNGACILRSIRGEVQVRTSMSSGGRHSSIKRGAEPTNRLAARSARYNRLTSGPVR